MSGIECFLVVPTDHAECSLRRYAQAEDKGRCPYGSYHDARVPLPPVPVKVADDGTFISREPEVADDDPSWPATCACGYVFADDDRRQVFTETLWTPGDGREFTLRDAPAGAMYDAFWMGDWARVNGSGPCWTIICPGTSTDGRTRSWHPGDEASNCTRKGEDHDCWCCHGEAPKLTVDKQPEPGRSTCAAGAGSIIVDGWHGFLRDGFLVVA